MFVRGVPSAKSMRWLHIGVIQYVVLSVSFGDISDGSKGAHLQCYIVDGAVSVLGATSLQLKLPELEIAIE